MKNPARPAAPKSHIENSVFLGISDLLYGDYLVRAATWTSVKKSSNLKRKESREAVSARESLSWTPNVDFRKFFSILIVRI